MKTGNKVRKRENGRLRVSLNCGDKTMVEKSHAGACDIKEIMAKARRTGMAPVHLGSPIYGDFSNATGYHDMANKVIQANEAFMQLPAAIRSRFDNDPGQIIEFLSNDENVQEAVELGLIDENETEAIYEALGWDKPSSEDVGTSNVNPEGNQDGKTDEKE